MVGLLHPKMSLLVLKGMKTYEKVCKMKIEELDTKKERTWCPGCTNNAILQAVKKAIVNLVNKKRVELKNIVAVTGIGCHAKVYDYLNVNGFYALHGRVLPVMLGIKIANPQLTVLGFGGDGDTYAEGIAHFVHACRYNVDATMIVHDNQVFALTTGQATPTSEKGFKAKSVPSGVREKPLNPIVLALLNGATFVARGFALEINHLTKLIEEAIAHKGFSFIDVLQPCLVYHDHNTISYFKQHIYKLKGVRSYEEAVKKAMEWNYCFDGKIPIGIFYKINKPIYEEQWGSKPYYDVKRKTNWKIIEEFK